MSVRAGRSALAIVGGVLLGAMLTVVGLAQAGRLAPARPEALVVLAQMLESEHRRVDLLVERGDLEGAITALEALRRQRWPTEEQVGEAGLQLKHDAYGRLVRLRLEHPDVLPQRPAALLKTVDEGLGPQYLDLETNPFTARLVAERGEILEQLDRDDEALSAYEEALDMNRVLLDRELGGAP